MSTSPVEEAEVHIASFVVQHRQDAADLLARHVAGHDELTLALRGPTRSVVLCESAGRHAVMDRVESLNELPGVLNVLLVYHHAEPGSALDAEMPLPPVTGVSA